MMNTMMKNMTMKTVMQTVMDGDDETPWHTMITIRDHGSAPGQLSTT